MNHQTMSKEEALKSAENFILVAARMRAINQNKDMSFGIRYKAIILAEEALYVAEEYIKLAESKL